MQVFKHLVYEYQKGLRDLCLFTCNIELLPQIKKSLELQKIDYQICNIDEHKINVFFGLEDCLKIIKEFSCENLNLLDSTEDFILGIMLGYSKQKQYKRLLAKKHIEKLNSMLCA